MAIKATINLPNLHGQKWMELLQLEAKRLDPSKEYRVFFSDKKPVRSRAQNKYLWGVVYKTISDATGTELDELHELFKYKFALKTEFRFLGEISEISTPTSMMSTEEMTDYIDRIIRWAAQRDIHIPSPNEVPDSVYVDLLSRGI